MNKVDKHRLKLEATNILPNKVVLVKTGYLKLSNIITLKVSKEVLN